MALREDLKARGLSYQDAAALLTESGLTIRDSRTGLDRPVTQQDIARRSTRPLSKRWADALGIDHTAAPPGSPGTGGDNPGDDALTGAGESPPKPPPNARFEHPIPFVDKAGAKQRIAWAYTFIGTGLAAGSGYEGIGHVWKDQSDTLAAAWIKAAEESPWAARVVTAAEAGGPVGELVGVHVYLLAATAYVAGAAIPAGDALWPKYTKYRPVVQPREQAPTPNGDGPLEGTPDSVDSVQS